MANGNGDRVTRRTATDNMAIDNLGERVERERSKQEELHRVALKIIENSEFLRPLLYQQDASLLEEKPETGGYISGKYVGTGVHRRFERGEGSDYTDYLENSTVTDIGFDGYNLYVVDNEWGHYTVNDPEKDPRIIAGLPPIRVSAQQVETLGRDVSNKMGVTYNTSHPVFDAELGYLRTNFVSEKIAPYGNTMALRVSRPSLAIKDLSTMANSDVDALLQVLMRTRTNVLISGRVGSGKTEYQKALVGYIPQNQKITLMEDTLDSHIKEIYPHKDINSWRTAVNTDENSSADSVDFLVLLRAALRNFPDWAMVSEVRGEEAGALLSVALSGHSVMTTLHARGADNIPERLADMVSMGNSKMDYGALLRNILSVFNIGVHLERGIDYATGKTIRYIREIYEYVDYDKDNGIIGYPLYRRYEKYDRGTGEYKVVKQCYRMSDDLLETIESNRELDKLPEVFKRGEYPHKTMSDRKNIIKGEDD